jgi:hypothetical protein
VEPLVERAMEHLALPEVSSIRDVFGEILAKRSTEKNPDCALFRLLRRKGWPLDILNEDCRLFVEAIGAQGARRKCHAELMGKVGRPANEFNGSTDDFWSEIAAVRTLVANGFRNIRAIHKKQPDGSTSDYEASYGPDAAHIEVKNVRSNKTVLHVFDEEIRKQAASDPTRFWFHLAIRYGYDNPPTAEQDRRIRDYVRSLRGRVPPFNDVLDLAEAKARISVTAGVGTSMMFSGFGPDSPEPIDKGRFLNKIRDKAGEALAQMKDQKNLKVVVINYNSPSASISEDYLRDAEKLILEHFNGAVRPIILVARQLPSQSD